MTAMSYASSLPTIVDWDAIVPLAATASLLTHALIHSMLLARYRYTRRCRPVRSGKQSAPAGKGELIADCIELGAAMSPRASSWQRLCYMEISCAPSNVLGLHSSSYVVCYRSLLVYGKASRLLLFYLSFIYTVCLSVCLYVSCLCLWAMLPGLNKLMMIIIL